MRHDCANPSCRCPVSEGNQYCSEPCRSAGTAPANGTPHPPGKRDCACGHPACAAPEEGRQVH
jgi:hypothetical protein